MTLTAVVMLLMGAVSVSADSSVNDGMPYVEIVSGSKMTVRTNGNTLTGIKYMYTSYFCSVAENNQEITAENRLWQSIVNIGQMDPVHNGTAGYYSVSKERLINCADGSTFSVPWTGYYNFILTWKQPDGTGRETYYNGHVTELSVAPSASIDPANGKNVVFDSGEFTIQSVKYVYTGNTESYDFTTWNALKARGLTDKLHNGKNGYKEFSSEDYENDALALTENGYYTIYITYDGGELAQEIHITEAGDIPSVSINDAVNHPGTITINENDYTLTGVKYMYTASPYSYTTWQRYVNTGLTNTQANTSTGYRTVSKGTGFDGKNVNVSRIGYYTFILTYEGGETAQTVYVTTSATEPSVTVSDVDSLVTINPGGITLDNIKYIYTGEDEYTFTTYAAFVNKGKEFPAYNSATGFLSVDKTVYDINDLDGLNLDMDYPGWYTFYLEYADGYYTENIEITREMVEHNRPYVRVEDMDITIYQNGNDLYEILYMFTDEDHPYTYTTWHNFYTTGKQNTYINSPSGYRSIDCTGDTAFTCFDFGYYTFILKYKDANGVARERHQTVMPTDIRSIVQLETFGGTFLNDSAWRYDEGTQLYWRKDIGLIDIPSASDMIAPMESDSIVFAGWYTEPTYQNKVTTWTLERLADTTTLYAKWQYTQTTVKTSQMWYQYNTDGFNVQGVKAADGSLIKTSYFSNYYTYYSNPIGTAYTVVPSGSSAYSGTTLNLTADTTSSVMKSIGSNLYMGRSLVTQGNYCEVNFIIYNAGSTDVNNFTFGVTSDVQIGSDDYAMVTVNSDEDGTYIMMDNGSLAFRLYTYDAAYWIGGYSSSVNKNRSGYQGNVFNDTSGNLPYHKDLGPGNSKIDSAMAFHYRNLTIPAKQYIVKTVRFGVGTAEQMGGSAKASLTLKGNGGTFDNGESTKIVVGTGSTVAISAGGTPVREGYTFTGWNTSANGSGTSYAGTETISKGTLYALWARSTDYPLYKLYNKSYVRVYNEETNTLQKLGSATARIQLTSMTTGMIVQQGTCELNAVSADEDYRARVTITSGYKLPNEISVKIGSKWLSMGKDFTYSLNADNTQAILVVPKAKLTGNTYIYIYGVQSLVDVPDYTVTDMTVAVNEATPVPVSLIEEDDLDYTYQWYICNDLAGNGKRALSSASSKTQTLAFGGAAAGDYYYTCKVRIKRQIDGETTTFYTDVATVHVVKSTFTSQISIDPETKEVSVTENPDNTKVVYTYYKDAECTVKTDYDNGATTGGGRPIKPQADNAPYYVKAFIPEGKRYLELETVAEEFGSDKLPDLPFIEKVGNIATLRDNNTGVTAIKWMYSVDQFSYTTWKKYYTEGQKDKTANSKQGYRAKSGTVSEGVSSLDGLDIELTKAGFYTFLITFDNGQTEVAYTFANTESDTYYQKPLVNQPTYNGRLVVFDDNESGLYTIKYMYSATNFTYTTWSKFYKQGKLNTAVNGSAGYQVIKGSVTEGVSSLDEFALTLPENGYYVFLMTYGDGKEVAKTVIVSEDYTSSDIALLTVSDGDITASTYSGTPITHIKLAGASSYTSGDTIHVNSVGTYSVQCLDAQGAVYFLVANVNEVNGETTPTVDKSQLSARLATADSHINNSAVHVVDTRTSFLAPGSYVLTEDRDTYETEIADARAVYNDPDVDQSAVNAASTQLNRATSTYTGKIFEVIPQIITVVNGNTIQAQATSEGYTLYVLRYNCDASGNLVPSVWPNWTGFQSQTYRNIKTFQNGTTYQFPNAPNGIYTFIVQQRETDRKAEYLQHAIVCVGATKEQVAKDTLDARIAECTELLGTVVKESAAEEGQLCVKDKYYTAAQSAIADGTVLAEQIDGGAVKDIEDDLIPAIVSLTRAINNINANKYEMGELITYDPIEITVNPDQTVDLARGNLEYAFISYGHYTKWAQVNSAGYVKVTSANVDDTKIATYRSAVYNGEYTALCHYTDGTEEFKYFTISGIVYPFGVSYNDGVITINVAEDKIATQVAYGYGNITKNSSADLIMRHDPGAVSDIEFTAMGNGIHTVLVRIDGIPYLQTVEATDITEPVILQKEDAIAVFVRNLPVTGVCYAEGHWTTLGQIEAAGRISPAVDTWLTKPEEGEYTFYYQLNGEDRFEYVTISD